MLYYRARYYDPELEAFISQDPLGDAQRYVGGNPVSFMDPLGLWHKDAAGVPQPDPQDWYNEGTIDETPDAVISLAPVGRVVKALTGCKAIQNTWVFGNHKSAVKWANRMEKGNWTSEKITQTLAKGKKYPAPNRINPSHPATRYENSKTGDYIVIDDLTREILQISRPRFIPNVK